MRTFACLTPSDLPVPDDLLHALIDRFGAPGSWVVVGAAARDLAFTVGKVTLPSRATHDLDLAVAAEDDGDFAATLDGIGEPTPAWQRRALLGHQLDVVPFGAIEDEGVVVIDWMSLNVLGCAEAARHADHLELPSGRVLPVTPLELIAVLKLLAFKDRFPGQTKDLEDLKLVLRAASDGVYGDEVWEDADVMATAEFDHELAAAYRLGRRGAACFEGERSRLLAGALSQTKDRLRDAWRRERLDVLDAWFEGLAAGLAR